MRWAWLVNGDGTPFAEQRERLMASVAPDAWVSAEAAPEAMVVEVDDTSDLSTLPDGGRGTLLVVDRSSRPTAVSAVARRRPHAVVAQRPAVAAVYTVVRCTPVWTWTTEPPTQTEPHDVVIITGDRSSSEERSVRSTMKLWPGRIVVTGPRSASWLEDPPHHPGGLVGDARDPVDVLADLPTSIVVILPSSKVVPDVALAYGHHVASARAPVLVDWRLVPTLEPRALAGRRSVGLVDVLEDPVLRTWLTNAAVGRLCTSVRRVDLRRALDEAMETTEMRRDTSDLMSSDYWCHLSATGLASHLDKLRSARPSL